VASEHERIREIQRRLFASAPGASNGVQVSIGDDAAVLGSDARAMAISVDAAVEGTHFNRAWLSLRAIGQRAVTAALSDLAAMGASPRCAIVALTCPESLSDDEMYALIDGIADAQQRYQCTIAGGNLARGRELSITTTVIGMHGARPLLRSGARAGDGLFVTGVLGEAALGLRALQAGQQARAPHAVARWCAPQARIEDGILLARSGAVSAAIDVSDGLLQDLEHLCGASQLGCIVEAERVPLAEEASVADMLGASALELALSGGEDYELLFAAAAPVAGVEATRIGMFVDDPRLTVVDGCGAPMTLESARGFDHFGRAAEKSPPR
jgi:thiamine-monophosphate kinase